MGKATPDFFLEQNGFDYLLIGSVATACPLGHPWSSDEDADRLLDVFCEEGL